MFKDIKAVIFDMDGTLIDSMWLWTDIDVGYLASYGLELPPTLQSEIEGMSFTETAIYFKKRFGIKESIEEIKDTWNKSAYEKYAKEVELKKGVREFLENLSKKGMKLGIATSNSQELTSVCLKRLDVKKYFQSIITGCDVKKGKPEPDIYLKVATDLNVEPKDCLVFEDIIKGINAGQNAGMKVCAVYDDFSKDTTKEKKALAEYYIESYDEVNRFF